MKQLNYTLSFDTPAFLGNAQGDESMNYVYNIS